MYIKHILLLQNPSEYTNVKMFRLEGKLKSRATWKIYKGSSRFSQKTYLKGEKELRLYVINVSHDSFRLIIIRLTQPRNPPDAPSSEHRVYMHEKKKTMGESARIRAVSRMSDQLRGTGGGVLIRFIIITLVSPLRLSSRLIFIPIVTAQCIYVLRFYWLRIH